MSIVLKFEPDSLAEQAKTEARFIEFYRWEYPDLLNDGGAGYGIARASEETKKKIGKSSRGRKWPQEARDRASILRKGKPLSEKHRESISKGNKGKKKSAEHAAKCRVARLGIPHSPEIRKKISESGKGKKRTPEQIQNYKDAWKRRKAR